MDALHIVGTNVPRLDGLEKVKGGAAYVGDIALPGQWHAAVVRSPLPHARLVRLDTAAAEATGATVLTIGDLADIHPYFGSSIRDQPVVAADRVRFEGEPVAAVAARTPEAAAAAAELIDVEYEPLPHVTDPVEAIADGAPCVHNAGAPAPSRFAGGSPDLFPASPNICAGFFVRHGDGALGLAAADEVIEGTYATPAIQHAHLEPHSAIASWEQDRLTIWSSTQGPSVVRGQLADLFGLPHSRVRVRVPVVGGGFGGKSFATIEPLVAALARKTGRPVQLVLTREEVFQTLTRHAAVVRMATGFNRDGTLVARQVEILYDTGAYADSGPRTCRKGARLSSGPYRLPHQEVRSMAIYTNKVPAGAFRGFGLPQICWAYESQMDEIALHLDIDPVELRERNLLVDGESPAPGGRPISFSVGRCLDAVAEAVERPASIEASDDPRIRSARLLVGSGVACAMKSMTSPTTSIATVSMNADASVQVLTSSVDIGQGSRTVLAQIAGEVLGRPPSEIHVSLPDTDVTPFDQGTISSRITYAVGKAVLLAASKVRKSLLEFAAIQLEISPLDLELAGDAVRVRDSPTIRRSTVEVLRSAFDGRGGAITETSRVRVGPPEGRPEDDNAMPPAYMFAAAGAEVAVDPETGAVAIRRLVVASDVGRAINPRLCHMQNEGSMLMGVGSALFEELAYDGGQLVNGSFLAYPLPSIRDQPASFQSLLVEDPHPNGPFEARGIGEAAIAPVAAAIGNAVADALGGRRVRTIPLTPERVAAAIADAPITETV
jgi:CO/xanthine dehydrogenase Mo-binding subunit